ncbi:MAG: hypothetical protein GY798_29010, partial [Hyphomicrobiales bacterium]|nr:hypothetical protein [Hyphomicrobiales bacterium]
MTTSTKWGDEFQVNTTTDKDQINPEVAALLNGRFMAVWTDQSTPPGLEGLEPGDLDDLDPDDLPALFRIRAQMYEADGTPSGDEFVVNTSDYGLQAGAKVAVQADGTFLITWLAVAIEIQNGGIAPGSISILAQRFGPDGGPVGNEFAVGEELDAVGAGSVAQAGGRYASVWFDGANGITKLQVINADGTLSGTPVSFAGIATPEIA